MVKAFFKWANTIVLDKTKSYYIFIKYISAVQTNSKTSETTIQFQLGLLTYTQCEEALFTNNATLLGFIFFPFVRFYCIDKMIYR